MIKVSLCTDETALARGFVQIMNKCEDLQASWVLGAASEIGAALAADPPDILLLDWAAYLDFEMLAQMKSNLPDCAIILWVRCISPEFAGQAITQGVRGILRKTLPEEMLLRCIRNVAEGEIWLENSLTASLFQAKRVHLTRRERELLVLLSHGLKNKEIAGEMALSEGTVKIYVSRLFQKVGAKDRLELALFGLKNVVSSGMPSGRSSAMPAGTPRQLTQAAARASVFLHSA